MKRFLTFLIGLVLSITAFSQVTLSQEQIDSLPPSAKMAVQASVAKEEARQQLESVSKYVGLGKEVGEAVNGALSAVEEHVLSIADSDLGHTAIFIVCWKLLYKDIAGIIIGLLLLIGLAFWIIYDLKYIRNTESSFHKMEDECQVALVSVHGLGWGILFIASMICIFG